MPDPVRCIETGGVTEILIDRPPVNALDLDAIRSLKSAFEGADRQLPVVLMGSGAAFSAGVDTRAFVAYAPVEKAEMIRTITGMTAAILAHPAPVVAAVNGHALGGGFVLMLCADTRLIADRPDARFGLTEARAGVPFPAGPLEIIRHEIEPNLLRRLTLTSETIGAADLHQAGIADALVLPEDLHATARERALETASQPGFVTVKRQIRGVLAGKVAALARTGDDPFAASFET